MKPEIITAIIAAVVAVISASISIYGQARIAQLADRLAKRRETESREAQTAALMSKYRDPLLRSTIDLQSRLFNIHQQRYLEKAFQRSPFDKDYAIQNTLYVIAEYLGWVEILRREVQFLDLGDLETNRHLSELLVNINQAFGSSRYGNIFQLYNGEQRAIGEIMLVPRSTDNLRGYECIGYATFVKKMSDPDFTRWFAQLRDHIELIGSKTKFDGERLIVIHSRLIDLIDFLDPHCIRISLKQRTRIEQNQ
ncbi:hypothetical protein [Nostoc sp.]|uniref:hypothetical protein n=1 Tax=Nostoc sp. TaxID=1180 RepID=UPI002FF70AB6